MSTGNRSPIDAQSRDDIIFLVVGVLLVLDLLILPWFSISIGPLSATATATDAPDGGLVILAVLLAIAAIADLLVERYSPQTTVPSINGSRDLTRLSLVGVAVTLVFLKFLFNVHFSYFSAGFYLAVILCAGWVEISRRAL